jgi:hypothetical protein
MGSLIIVGIVDSSVEFPLEEVGIVMIEFESKSLDSSSSVDSTE